MDDAYKETGGLRWGASFMNALNASWPFAKLEATRTGLRIEMSFLGIWRERFDFARADIRVLQRQSGAVNVGLRVEHSRADYPVFILFWTFRFRTLKDRLERLGYWVRDS